MKAALVIVLGALLACSSSSGPADGGGGVGGGGAGGGGAGGGVGGGGAGGGGAGGSGGRGDAAVDAPRGDTGGVGGMSGAGGAGGMADAGRDAADAPRDAAGDLPANSGMSLDQCFMGLRPLEGGTQIVTKASADGRLRLRMAIETDGRFGTSGTHPWEMIRFALELDATRVCITDPAGAYKTSLHNCNDTATIVAGGVTYTFTKPDKPNTQVTVKMGATTIYGPTTLSNVSCIPAACRTGGPC